jgi:hypothetical protein
MKEEETNTTKKLKLKFRNEVKVPCSEERK